MTQNQSEKLIVKFITNQASKEEIELLTKWLEEIDNQKVFKEFVKINYAVDYITSDFDVELAKKELLQKINREQSIFSLQKMQTYLKYAAIVIVLIGITYFFQKENQFQQNNNLLVVKEESITLQLADGSIQTINTAKSTNIKDKLGKVIGKQEKDKIYYSNKNVSSNLTYNTLKIPYGKRFEIELSDGTIVQLNSGTTLKYPVQFLKNKNRQVFLTGEAFFEVAKDQAHPFIVEADKLNIEVLGTEFNVSAYAEDNVTDVVLVEGKVQLYKDTKNTTNTVQLTPGLKGSNFENEQNITTEKVKTASYTAWVNGSLVFRNIAFNEIIKKLERHYNVTFINKNKILGKEIFNASFKGESIEQVLQYFSDSYAIDYTIKDNKIIIQ